MKPPRYTASERQPFTPGGGACDPGTASGDRLYTYVVLAHATGLRQSELLGLRWSDIDLDGGWLHVRTQFGRDGTVRPVKTDAGKRPLPLPSPVVAELRAHRDRQAAERARAAEWHEGEFVFTTRTGRPVSQRNAHRSWTRILDRAGVAHRGVHHMRHVWVAMQS